MHKSIFRRLFIYIAILTIVLLFIAPIVWLFLTSLKTPLEATNFSFNFFKPKWVNYINVWLNRGFNNSFLNTIIIGMFTVLLSIFSGLLLAYAITRYPIRGKGMLSGTFITLRLLPEMVFLLPLYSLYRQIGLFDTKIGLTIAFQILTLPYSVLLLQSFILGVPKDMEDAGRIDGCSEWALLWKVVVPVIMPGIVACAILSFITVWTNLLFPLVLSYSKAETISIAISNFKGYGTFNWPLMATAAVLATVPQIIFFSLVNQHLVSGLTAGSVKY